jgi:hypothetical protein
MGMAAFLFILEFQIMLPQIDSGQCATGTQACQVKTAADRQRQLSWLVHCELSGVAL